MANILIVDDDQRVTGALVAQFTGAGHACSVLTHGGQVLDALRQKPFDLLMLDVMLPAVSGFELCRRIRRDAALYTLPIIIITAMASDEEVMHGLAQGADDYIVKPFDVQNVAQRAEALLRASAEGHNNDALTELPSSDKTKRELQRRTIAQETFELGYAELVGIREFAYKYGPEARMKAIRHFARALENVGREMKIDNFFVGHMGGGHFVCMLTPDKAKKYCQAVKAVWDQHAGELTASLGPGKASVDNDMRTALDVLICVTHHSKKDHHTPQAMFETLSQIRHKAQAARSGGVYIDRRS